LFYFCARVGGVMGETAPFLTWPKGNGRIVDHLAKQVGDRLRLHQLVTDIVPGANGVEVVAYDAAQREALRYLADDVIVATPKFVAHRLVRPLRESAREATADFHYAPWLVANLHLRERPRSDGFPFAWDNVLFDSASLGYVVATHQELADFGASVWTYYRPFWEQSDKAARQLIRALDHATAVEAILTDLGRAHRGLSRAIERIDVMLWGHGMVTPTPGFMWGSQRKKAAESVGRVVFAHSDCSGLALLEEAFDCGVGAAESVLRAREALG
jgi:predicted NAD/FAD-binding protein